MNYQKIYNNLINRATRSADMRAHKKPHGTLGKSHDHKSHGPTGIIAIPIGSFQ